MELSQVKVGQTVKIARADLFYHQYVGCNALVTAVDSDHVHVVMTSGDDIGETDYGRPAGLELVSQAAGTGPTTIKEAIEKVEAALAELKALVG